MNNIPAFPSFAKIDTEDGHGDLVPIHGMTLRDYFAAKAMQGILSNSGLVDGINSVPEADQEKLVAEDAYAFADAMLAARNRQPETQPEGRE